MVPAIVYARLTYLLSIVKYAQPNELRVLRAIWGSLDMHALTPICLVATTPPDPALSQHRHPLKGYLSSHRRNLVQRISAGRTCSLRSQSGLWTRCLICMGNSRSSRAGIRAEARRGLRCVVPRSASGFTLISSCGLCIHITQKFVLLDEARRRSTTPSTSSRARLARGRIRSLPTLRISSRSGLRGCSSRFLDVHVKSVTGISQKIDLVVSLKLRSY